jgi:hypothetical protein
MTAKVTTRFDKVFLQLKKLGLLLLSGSAFPSVVNLIARSDVKGSWWSHPDAHAIFAVSELLEAHPDVLIMKLLEGKVTFIHRELWSQIYSIGVAREDWQMKDLSAPAKALLTNVENEKSLDTNKLAPVRGMKPGDLARELELRLLVHANQVHTESGAHAKRLETWDSWADRVGLKDRRSHPQHAKQLMEKRVKALNDKFGADARLPWQ